MYPPGSKLACIFVEIQDYDLSYLQEILKNIYDVHDEYPESTVNSDCLKINLLDLLTGRSRLQGGIELQQLEAKWELVTWLHF